MTTEATGTHAYDLPIPDRMNWLLGGIRRVISGSEVVRRRLVDGALLLLAWNRLGDIVKRFNALYEKWRAGTLKPTRKRPSRKGEARATPRTNKLAALPRRAGWLTRMVPEASWGGGTLTQVLYTPDILAFITAVPQARRILRPLCLMFGDKLIPPILKLPRRPRPPKPRARKQRKRKPRPFARIDYSREPIGMHRHPPDASWGLAPSKSKNDPNRHYSKPVSNSLRYRNYFPSD